MTVTLTEGENQAPRLATSPQPSRHHGATLNAEGLDLLFRKARTHNGWLNKPVGDDTLRQLYDLMMFAARSLGLDCGPMSGFDPIDSSLASSE